MGLLNAFISDLLVDGSTKADSTPPQAHSRTHARARGLRIPRARGIAARRSDRAHVEALDAGSALVTALSVRTNCQSAGGRCLCARVCACVRMCGCVCGCLDVCTRGTFHVLFPQSWFTEPMRRRCALHRFGAFVLRTGRRGSPILFLKRCAGMTAKY